MNSTLIKIFGHFRYENLSTVYSFILFIYFHFIYSWLKITHLHTKKSLYSLYSNNIELTDVNSVTEQVMQSFPNQFLKSFEQADRHTHTHSHICTHIHQSITPGNASIPVQWVFWCLLYKSYMLQIYFKKLTRTLQRHAFFNFSFKNA